MTKSIDFFKIEKEINEYKIKQEETFDFYISSINNLLDKVKRAKLSIEQKINKKTDVNNKESYVSHKSLEVASSPNNLTDVSETKHIETDKNCDYYNSHTNIVRENGIHKYNTYEHILHNYNELACNYDIKDFIKEVS
ncbi:hypothetical protein HEP_00519400, partial [Hepatocystis sp. ex Piliocolobus tephrosceles]